MSYSELSIYESIKGERKEALRIEPPTQLERELRAIARWYARGNNPAELNLDDLPEIKEIIQQVTDALIIKMLEDALWKLGYTEYEIRVLNLTERMKELRAQAGTWKGGKFDESRRI